MNEPPVLAPPVLPPPVLDGPDFAAVDRDNPWPGLAPFTEAQREFFFGRDTESAELLRRVRGRPLTVLFGQSGLGKTSLLCAGLFPRLRDEDLIPVLVRINHAPAAPPPAEQVLRALAEAIAAGRLDGPVPATERRETLWEYFHRRGLEFWTPRNRPATLVLVFDQFEEIYTLGRLDEAARQRGRQFLEELADLIENRPPAALRNAPASDEAPPFDFGPAPCKIVLSLREDYLPDLEGFRNAAPSISENRMRLQPLNGRQALDVLSTGGGRLIDPPTAIRVVRFVAGAPGTENSPSASSPDPAPGAEELDALQVEPALLSIFAHELNRKRQALGLDRITPDLLAGHRDQIISDFYHRSLADLPAKVRRFIEDQLLTPNGFRDSLAMEIALGPDGLSREVIDTLVARRLLHIDQRLGAPRLELTHDVLTGPARSNRDQRVQRESLARAEHREKKIRAQLARARRRLAFASILTLFTLGLAIASLFLRRQAEQERTRAEAARNVASNETIRAESSARRAAGWIKSALILPALPKAMEFLSSATNDHDGNAVVLRDLCLEYQRLGERTHEIRARLWLAHVDLPACQPWLRTNADELASLLLDAMAEADERQWPQLLDFHAPARAPIVESIFRRLPGILTNASPSRLRAAVAVGEHANAPLWWTPDNPQSLDDWTRRHAADLTRLLLDLLVQSPPGNEERLVAFFEPAHVVIPGGLLDQVESLVDAERENPRPLEAALFVNQRLKALAAAKKGPARPNSRSSDPRFLETEDPSLPPARDKDEDSDRFLLAIKEHRRSKPGTSSAIADIPALLERGGGLLTTNFAFCQSLPLNEAISLTPLLRKKGYQPRQFRPYTTRSNQVLVAAFWDRTASERTLHFDLTTEEVRDQENQMRSDGKAPVDLAWYLTPDRTGALQERFAVVWQKLGDVAPRYQILLHEPEAGFQNSYAQLRGKGLRLTTAQLVTDRAGLHSFCGILSSDPRLTRSTVGWYIPPAEVGQLDDTNKPPLLIDARPIAVRRDIDRTRRWQHFLEQAESLLRANPTNRSALVSRIECLFHLGRRQQALEVLEKVPPDKRTARTFYWLTLTRLRLGDLDGARDDAATHARAADAVPGDVLCLNTLVQATAGEPVPLDLEKRATNSLYNVACVYAWASGLPQRSPADRERLANHALDLLAITSRSENADLAHYLSDSDLDALRERPRFQKLLAAIDPPAKYVRIYFQPIGDLPEEARPTLFQGTPNETVRNARDSSAQELLFGEVLAGVAAHEEAPSRIRTTTLWVSALDPSGGSDLLRTVGGAIDTYIRELRDEKLGYTKLKASARRWWDAFEAENAGRLESVLRLMHQLADRGATIEDFFMAFVYSNTDSIQANIHYLDFTQIKKSLRAATTGDAEEPATPDDDPQPTPSRPDRFTAFLAWMNQPAASTAPHTDVARLDAPRIRELVGQTKTRLGLDRASAPAREWWASLEAAGAARPALLLRFLEELASRPTRGNRFDDLFDTAALAQTDNLLGCLHYLDYRRLRQEETEKKSAQAGPGAPRPPTPAADALVAYARARLLVTPPPPPPAPDQPVKTAADLEALTSVWRTAIEDYPGEVSADLVYYAVSALRPALRDALTNGIALDLPQLGTTLCQAAKYLVHEKDVTLYLFVNLPAAETLTAPQRRALEEIHETIRKTYEEQLHDFAKKWRLTASTGTDLGRQPGPDGLERLFESLRAAQVLQDMARRIEISRGLQPDEKALRAVLAKDVSPETIGRVLAFVRQHGALLEFGPTLPRNLKLQRVTTEELRNPDPDTPLGRVLPEAAPEVARTLLRPGTEFYLVLGVDDLELSRLKSLLKSDKVSAATMAFPLVFWNGSRWALLGPLWDDPGILEDARRPAR